MTLSSIEQLNKKVYDDFYSDNWIDGWEEKDKRYNFYHLFKIAPTLEHQSILDVGCGTGEMIKYIPKSTKYLGIDIYRPALKIARQSHPNRSFKFGNILTFKSKPFDYVFCSGALSLNVTYLDQNNYEFLEKALNKIWLLCRKGIAFNILTNQKHRNSKRSYLYMYNPNKVEKLAWDIVKDKGTVDWKNTPLDDCNDQATFYVKRV